MNTSITPGGLKGSVEVHRIQARVIELRYRGYISRGSIADALIRASNLIRQHPGIDTILSETREYDGHDPGNVALMVQWFREHATSLRTLVVVTRNSTLSGLTKVIEVLMPGLAVHTAAHRGEALALLDGHVRVRRRRAA